VSTLRQAPPRGKHHSATTGRYAPTLSDAERDLARRLRAVGHSCRAIAKNFGVHHSTIARITAEQRETIR
jgi:IS30 family transposase